MDRKWTTEERELLLEFLNPTKVECQECMLCLSSPAVLDALEDALRVYEWGERNCWAPGCSPVVPCASCAPHVDVRVQTTMEALGFLWELGAVTLNTEDCVHVKEPFPSWDRKGSVLRCRKCGFTSVQDVPQGS